MTDPTLEEQIRFLKSGRFPLPLWATARAALASLRRLAAAEAELARMREALSFYADKANWTNDEQVNNDELFDTAMSSDKHGTRAREALGAKP